MTNTIMTNNINSSRRYIYSIGIVGIVCYIILYGGSMAGDIRLDERITIKQNELTIVEDTIAHIGSEKAFFSYKFAE